MKHKIKIILGAGIVLCTSILSQIAYAQNFVPLGALAQEYITRITQEIREVDKTSPETMPHDTVVVNSDAVIRNAVTESIDTITRTTQEITEQKTKVVEDIKQSVKEDIDTSIIEIRKQTNKQAYELQRAVDVERTELFENVTQAIEIINLTETTQIQELRKVVDASIRKIQISLETEAPNVTITFDRSQKNISETLTVFERTLSEKKELILTREGALIYLDSDLDGVSDYDEMYIYGTDPDDAYTVPGELNDGEKIRRGINPLSENQEKKQYQDPRQDRESFVSDVYQVEKVQFIKEENKLVFEGVALPNSFVTLHIFSTPIIVTVQTNSSGKWTYELNEELENGEHQIYVSTVDSTGKIIARSNPVLFTKTADAASIGIVGSLDSTVKTQNFLQDNFILITLAVLISVVILGMMFVGNHRNIRSAVSELQSEVNFKN